MCVCQSVYISNNTQQDRSDLIIDAVNVISNILNDKCEKCLRSSEYLRLETLSYTFWSKKKWDGVYKNLTFYGLSFNSVILWCANKVFSI